LGKEVTEAGIEGAAFGRVFNVGGKMIVDFGADVGGAVGEEGGLVRDSVNFFPLSGLVCMNGGVKWEKMRVGADEGASYLN
jgi:hypothetical protein